MINLIGAFVVGLLLLEIVLKRPDTHRIERALRNAPLWTHLLVLALLCLTVAGNLFAGAIDFMLANILVALLGGLTFLVHEAGHVFFMWAGTFGHYLGGTITEVLFTFAPAIYFFTRRRYLVASLFLFWFGFACHGIARYVSDARAQALPVTGDHDWRYMLGALGLLEYDRVFGIVISAIGVLATVTSLLCYLYVATYLRRQQSVIESDV